MASSRGRGLAQRFNRSYGREAPSRFGSWAYLRIRTLHLTRNARIPAAPRLPGCDGIMKMALPPRLALPSRLLAQAPNCY